MATAACAANVGSQRCPPSWGGCSEIAGEHTDDLVSEAQRVRHAPAKRHSAHELGLDAALGILIELEHQQRLPLRRTVGYPRPRLHRHAMTRPLDPTRLHDRPIGTPATGAEMESGDVGLDTAHGTHRAVLVIEKPHACQRDLVVLEHRPHHMAQHRRRSFCLSHGENHGQEIHAR